MNGKKIKLANSANPKTWNNSINSWDPKWAIGGVCIYVYVSLHTDIYIIFLCLYFLSSSLLGSHISLTAPYFKYKRFLIVWHCNNRMRECKCRFQNHRIHICFSKYYNILDMLSIYLDYISKIWQFLKYCLRCSSVFTWSFGDSGISALTEIRFM